MDWNIVYKRIKEEIARKELKTEIFVEQGIDIDRCLKSNFAITTDELKKIAEILRVPPSLIIDGDSNPNSKRTIPVFNIIPPEFPLYSEAEVYSHIEIPVSMFVHSEFVIKHPLNLVMDPVEKADYYYFKYESKFYYDKPSLVKISNRYFIARMMTPRDGSVELITDIFAPRNNMKVKIEELKIIGLQTGIYWDNIPI